MSQGITASNLLYMLFEGLVKTDKDGKMLPAIAEKIIVSPDMTTYTFILKDTNWSNGDPVRAQDFEYSWKSQLNPDMKAPHSYMLEPIKGASQALRGAKTNQVGITAIDDKTLKVELEKPTPYFLQMCASPAYFPVNQKWTESHPDFKIDGQFACVSNGPFALISYVPQDSVQLRKNSKYWDSASVKLHRVVCTFVDDNQAFAKFTSGSLDWVGNPFSSLSTEQILQMQKTASLTSTPAASTQFIRVNVTKPPFSNTKMRRAFGYCIDLQGIINKAMDSDETVATSFVPKCLGLVEKPYFTPHDLELARKLYEEALAESGLTQQTLPPITLSYIGSDRSRLIVSVIKDSIKEAFNIDVILQEETVKSLSQKLLTKDYTLALSTWLADYLDPSSFLNVFATDNNGVNNTGWTNPTYTKLLQNASVEMDEGARFKTLSDAEDILMQDMPILPLFHLTFTYATSDDLQGDLLSPLGIMDITTAFRVNKKPNKT